MQKKWKEYLREGPETSGRDRDKMLRELESKLIAVTSASRGALSRKDFGEIEKVVDEYYWRWKA